MTLNEVEQRSRGEFGISSLGAYERGDRVLSVDRLIRLAEIYRVDVSDLMPDRTETLLDLPALEQPHLPAGLVLDPSRLRVLSEDAAAAASNFRAVILALRRTHAQEVVVVRKSDSAVLAAFVGCDTSLVDRLLAPRPRPRRELVWPSADPTRLLKWRVVEHYPHMMDAVPPASNGGTPEARVGQAWSSFVDSAGRTLTDVPAALRNGRSRSWTMESAVSPPDSDAEAQMGEPGSDAGVVARSEDANGIGVEGEDVERTAPEVLEHVYQPLLQSLKTECRRILGAAETEAENVRSKAQDEARRILTDAHRERSSLFRRATSKQALMYEEADADIQRWLDELDEERQATLDRAHDDAARLLRMAAQQAETYAHERREAADREAQAIVVEARLEAAKYTRRAHSGGRRLPLRSRHQPRQ